jgi:uncharacterized protein (DUF2342 family)
MTSGTALHGHATAVADILAGYRRAELAAYRERLAERRDDGGREHERFARETDRAAGARSS